MQEDSEHLYLLSSLYVHPLETREQQVLLHCMLCPEVETGLEMLIPNKDSRWNGAAASSKVFLQSCVNWQGFGSGHVPKALAHICNI